MCTHCRKDSKDTCRGLLDLLRHESSSPILSCHAPGHFGARATDTIATGRKNSARLKACRLKTRKTASCLRLRTEQLAELWRTKAQSRTKLGMLAFMTRKPAEP